MFKEKVAVASLLVMFLSVTQIYAEAVDVSLRTRNEASDEKAITRPNLIAIKRFILNKGLCETYCNRYKENPAYHTENFSFYLNPDSGLSNRKASESNFHSLTIRSRNNKSDQYRRVEFLDTHYISISVTWPTKITVSQIHEFVIEAMKEILREIEIQTDEPVYSKENVSNIHEEIIDISRLAITHVTASSVNGGRSLDNEFYGILNLFDNGTNIINGKRCDYWLSDRDSQHWLNFSFDKPVSVNSVVVETTGNRKPEEFALEFIQVSDNSKKTTKYFESVKIKGFKTKFDLKIAIVNISEIKIIFPGPDMMELSEIRILGSVISNIDIAQKNPKIGVSKIIENVLKATRIRIKNTSPYDYELVLVGGEFFGDLKSGELTDYKIYEIAYKYNSARLAIKDHVFRLQPEDYVGEAPLGEGHFTYNIGVQDFEKKILSIETVKEK